MAKDVASEEAGARVFEKYTLRSDNKHMELHTQIVRSGDQAWTVVEDVASHLQPHLIVMGSEATVVGGKARLLHLLVAARCCA